MEKIKVENLTFQYPLAEGPAITGIDFSVEANQFVVILGKSGCGKSTLLRHFKKSLAPYGEKSGRVLVDGVAVEDMDDRESAFRIGFVQQNPDTQIVTDKVWHELAFGLESLGLSNDIIKRRVAEMASYFGINEWFRKDVAELSGGQKQMLNLASIMVMQPEILVLDEPVSQLDPIAASDFLNTLYKINRDLGTTIILSEHRLDEVFPLVDKAVVLDKGKVLAEGEPEKIGLTLATMEEGGPHAMYYGMPAVMRAFPAEVLPSGESLPLTIRQGRLLAEKLLADVPAEVYQGEFPAAESMPADGMTAAEDNETELVAGVGDTAGRMTDRKGDSTTNAIKMKGVTFRYDRREEDVLRDLDLEVKRGELFCLLGGNGSGKSTTLKAITGIIRPQRGKITMMDGAKAALVPQNPQALFSEITVEEEIFEGMEPTDFSDEEKISRTEEMLKLMEIEHLRKQNPYDLSGGEQQRLALAKVMAYGPDILLLDEPTKGLDPFFKITLGRILQDLCRRGITVFLVSHDIDFCAKYADECAMFFDGSVTARGKAHAFFEGNSYYTTTINRMTRSFREDLLLAEEAAAWISHATRRSE